MALQAQAGDDEDGQQDGDGNGPCFCFLLKRQHGSWLAEFEITRALDHELEAIERSADAKAICACSSCVCSAKRCLMKRAGMPPTTE